MNRLTLRKLVFEGDNKPTSSIEFAPGCNVISGPSDTGKSLIYECLNYIFGGEEKPKEPPEAKGYTNLFLTISTDDSIFTIERSVLSNDVRIYDSSYDERTEDTKIIELSSRSNAKSSLSNYILNIIGISEKKLKKNEQNETISLTFNVLKRLLLISEGAIQNTYSPILTGHRTSATSEKALFRYMLTGIDYSNIIVQKKPAIRKAEANARINILNHLIKNNSLSIVKNTTKDELSEQLLKIDISIENEVSKVSAGQLEIVEMQKQRKEMWHKTIIAESKIDQLGEILNRFELLSKHYQSDLDRLDAIIETGQILILTADILCPLCGSGSTHHRPECVISAEEIEGVKISCAIEKEKIHTLQHDLDITIAQVSDDRIELIKLRKINEDKYRDVDKTIHEKLEPSIAQKKGYLSSLFEIKKDVEIMIGLYEQIKELEELKAEAELDLKPRPKVAKTSSGVQTAEVNELLKVIENTLIEWGYPDLDRIGFSEDKQDITIGSKNRADQGKGYRAITHAAFIISLMEYCIMNEKPHPGFVVLDSPLVTFRSADKIVNTDEKVTDDMKTGFYTSLSNLNSDSQIIVIENDDPPESILKNINYIHFTKDPTQGRYGFLPPVKS